MRSSIVPLFSATTLGGTTVVYSPIVNVQQAYTYCLQHLVAGSVFAGSIQLQGSCDQAQNPQGVGVTNWFDIGSPATISAVGVTYSNQDGIGYQWIRVKFTPATGTGSLTSVVSIKGV